MVLPSVVAARSEVGVPGFLRKIDFLGRRVSAMAEFEHPRPEGRPRTVALDRSTVVDADGRRMERISRRPLPVKSAVLRKMGENRTTERRWP
jgi:hypothetical protein